MTGEDGCSSHGLIHKNSQPNSSLMDLKVLLGFEPTQLDKAKNFFLVMTLGSDWVDST